MGFPIRRFTDQSLFAAPRDLSQRTTSFIASQRQGIHQIPLRHLIALIAKARVPVSSIDRQSTDKRVSWLEKTSFASNAPGDLSGQAPKPTTGCSKGKMTTRRLFGFPGSHEPFSFTPRIIRPSTECASSSQCQRSKAGRNGEGSKSCSPAVRPSSR